MKRSFVILLAIILVSNIVCAQAIAFKNKNLKTALLDKGYDKNKDGEIEISEIDTVSKLNISNSKIESLDGLPFFKNLKELNANNNRIANLEPLFGSNSITALYILNNRFGKKLTLKNLPNLEVLGASQNGLEETDFTGTKNIKSLYLMNNALVKIDLKELPLLESADLYLNKTLKYVDISSNRNLTELYLLSTSLTELNVIQNPLLKTLYIERQVKLIKGSSTLKPAPIIKEN